MIGSLRRKALVGSAVLIASALTGLGLAAPVGAATIIVKPSSNLPVGQGSYPVTITAPKGTFTSVPDGGATPVARTVGTKVGAAAITAPAGTFTAADIGTFVDDGVGGPIVDGAAAAALTPLVPVYPRQGIPYIKSVNLTGSSATLSQKSLSTGTSSVNLVPSQIPVVLLAEASGSLPFIAPVLPGPGLCLSPFFPSSLCPHTAGNLAFDANKVVPVFAAADGSFTASMTLLEGTIDGGLGTVPGPVYVKIFDPDGPGIAPTAPFSVPSTEPGATPIGCAPGLADRSIPNPAIGGVDYCMVTAIALNAGVQSTLVPFQLKQVPITWAASGGGFVFGDAFVITGQNFANDDTLVKVVVVNGKAKQTANPLLKCTALNQTILGQHADGVGQVQIVIPTYASGCTVPPTSSTKVTIIGTKDVQRTQIPPNDIIGTNLPKKTIVTIPMTNPGG